MSPSGVPYYLRGNKYVDREMFVEVLSRVDRIENIEHYLYLGFGSWSLEDFRVIHSRFGNTKMLSIEQDTLVYGRQKFNIPYECIKCLNMTSRDLLDTLGSSLSAQGYSVDDKMIAWLDYTDPKDTRKQLDEFGSLVSQVPERSVLKITLNADVPQDEDLKSAKTREERLDRLFQRWGSRLGQDMPESAEPESMTRDRLPSVLTQAVGKVAGRSLDPRLGKQFFPISSFRYADTNQMVTVTGMVLRTVEKEDFFRQSGVAGWEFYCADWSVAPREIRVPNLTLKERFVIERGIYGKSIDEILTELDFRFFDEADQNSEVIAQFQRYYRFLPYFHRVVV